MSTKLTLLFNIGTKFKFQNSNSAIIYEIVYIHTTLSYYECKQTYNPPNQEWPLTIYLNKNQLNHVLSIIKPQNKSIKTYSIGTTFEMNNIKYKIESIDNQSNNYKCINLIDNSIYELSFNELNSNANILDNKTNANGIYSLSSSPDIDYDKLSLILPYFTDFMLRKEASVFSQNDYKNNPSGYLEAIRDKYNILHPKEFDDPHNNNIHYHLRPWIEGKMQKLMAQTGYFGTQKWKTRLFRLFDEALVWFEDTSRSSFFKKNKNKNKNANSISPSGVLPLAMITGLKTCDIDKMKSFNVSENELLRLELEIGNEGVIILKCSDYNQRIKWYECLHTAIFTVKRPLFSKKKDIWRISEPKSKNKSKQITKNDVKNTDLKRKESVRIRMGKSLVLKLGNLQKQLFDDDIGVIDDNKNNDNDDGDIDDIELGNITKTNSNSNSNSNSKDKSLKLSNVPSNSKQDNTTNNMNVL